MDQLTDTEIDALKAALDDEYKALATYDQVIEDHGSIRPFINIREAEARHVDALLNLFEKYGLSPPANNWLDEVPRFENVRSACEAAVQDEIDNADLYERIMRQTERPDILTVFRNLRDASQERHLPAFRRCVERR